MKKTYTERNFIEMLHPWTGKTSQVEVNTQVQECNKVKVGQSKDVFISELSMENINGIELIATIVKREAMSKDVVCSSC